MSSSKVLKLDDKFGDLHPSGIVIQRALDRSGLTHRKLAAKSSYKDYMISRLLKLERSSYDLILNVLRAMVELGCFTSMDEINEYFNELPERFLTTGERATLISELKTSLDKRVSIFPKLLRKGNCDWLGH